MLRHAACGAGLFLLLISRAWAQAPAAQTQFAEIDALFDRFYSENHIPGLVYGVVANGKLSYVHAVGVQDTKTGALVTADTVFRIASMSKNFTALAALKLRDDGKVSFDAPAERYIPELARLKYPTSDSPKITVRDLLSHTAGFVGDDPWGDRQLAMPEEKFSQLLAAGLSFSRPPGMSYEYSNLGYALAGRLVTNTSGRNFADYIGAAFLVPLGMTSTSYDPVKVPAKNRAAGYRLENNTWVEESILDRGAFGAMGGLMTSATDYGRFIAWQLAAWPPRDGAEDRVLRRSSVREIGRGETYATVLQPTEPSGCARSATYGLGMVPYVDCTLGAYLGHAGGLPGFGSYILMLPERGLGIFAFANLTYAPLSRVMRQAAGELVKSGAFPRRIAPASDALVSMAVTVSKIYATGSVLAANQALAMNVLLDRNAKQRDTELAALKDQLGTCSDPNPIRSDSAMAATITYPCEHGTLVVRIALAPGSVQPTLQTLEFQR